MKEPQNIAVLSTLKLKDLFIVVAACKRFSVNTTAENCVYSDSMQVTKVSGRRLLVSLKVASSRISISIRCSTDEGILYFLFYTVFTY